MNETGLRRTLPDQSSGSGHTFDTPRHQSIIDPILSKRVCFYKSGDPQFNGLRMVINHRTFKTFDALLDSLSKKVPLPFGVRNITTPRGVHGIHTLDELEDGKSYICSDSHKVKPINLALARKKLPPWYHATPVSSRQRTLQQARFFPGRGIRRQEPVVVRTPKSLVVFCNGDPSIKHTVVLHKKTTPSYESILDYISELMQFHVVKLHTPDGRRVDGLPGLILGSGTVVAVGREPFRPAMYNAQKPPARARQHTKPVGIRRKRALKRKKKSPSYSSKSRNFSASSERYIVHQINNTIAESSCDLPSHTTNSVELDSNRMLESVAETEGDTCLGDGAEGQGCSLPDEDNIEKSFRVNQDGSMTVEMKVRLTIKEEETVHWTTTLTRSSVADQLNVNCLPEPEAEQDICSSKSNSLNSQSPTASIDTINKDKTKDNNDDDDPPSLGNGAMSDSSHEEDDIKIHTDVMSPRRAPTPGYRRMSKQQASVKSIKSVAADGIQEGLVGSYSYREQTENGTMTEQYCMVKQSTTRPVPKPRLFGSVDANSRNVSAFKSAEKPEKLQTESSGEEVTETVLHFYEQQTCQDNLQANVCAHSMSASGVSFGRSPTSETGQLSSNNESELERLRPSTASESISTWRAESMTVTSDSHLSSMKTGAIQGANRKQFHKVTKGHGKPQQKQVSKDMWVSSKPKVTNKHVRRVRTPPKRQKDHSAEAADTRTKVKTFSSAGFIKRIYGHKSKSAKSMKRFKKRPTQNRDRDFATSLPVLGATIKTVKDSNTPTELEEKINGRVSFETNQLRVTPTEVSPPRGVLTRQTSMHLEKKSETESHDMSQSVSSPAFNSSSSVTKEYVESWLEKAHLNPPSLLDEKSKKLAVVASTQTKNVRHGESESKPGLIIVAEETPVAPTRHISGLQPESLVASSVKLRVQSLQSKLGLSEEKKKVSQQSHNDANTRHTEEGNSLCQKNSQEAKPLSNGICSAIIPSATEIPLGGEVGNPVKISFERATLSDPLSMVQQPLPPELLNTEHSTKDVSSAASSPLYRLSSLSSQRSDNHPLSMSPTSEKDKSPTHNMLEKTSAQTDTSSTLQGAELSRTPSTKRAPLVTNLSLERKMSLRKACLDKYTLANDATKETTTLSNPINTVGDEVPPHDICSTATQLPIKAHPEESQQSVLDLMCTSSLCSSVSPASLTSDERMSPASNSSSEHLSKETKMTQIHQKEAPSPKTSVKTAKPKTSPSPERKFQNKKSSAEHQNNSPKLMPVHSPHMDKTVLPNNSTPKHSTPNASPSVDRKHHKPKAQQKTSPYSQSLDMASPPVRHKSSIQSLSRNLSTDNPSEPTSKKQNKTSSQRKSQETPQSGKSTAELDKTLTCETLTPLEADKSDEFKAVRADCDKSMMDLQIMPQQLNMANQPNMKPVLEKICYSIKSIRRITQNKRPSCLEKSNSLPDFSSHVASTFGSSSKALLAFLSVMTLKEGLVNLNVDELNANHVSCAEALKMIDSLREIASIEDSHKLKTSLSHLQQSASKQLLQSWKGFQELSGSRSSTPNASDPELITEAGPEQDIEEKVIDEIMDNLDIPEKLKEELASLSESDNERKMSPMIAKRLELTANQNSHEITKHPPTEDAVSQDEKANTDVRSISKTFTDINQPESEMNRLTLLTEAAKLKPTDHTKEQNGQDLPDSVTECLPAEPNSKQIPEESQLYSTTSFESCRDTVHQENQENVTQQQQGHKDKKSTQETANMSGELSINKNLENDSCSFKTKEQDVELRQLRMQSEESIPENEFTHDDESDSDEEEQKTSSANKDLNEKESCKHSSDEDDTEVKCEKIKQECSEGEDLSDPESHSEEDEDEQQGSNYNVEMNDIGRKSISNQDSENQHLSEEEQLEVEWQSSEKQQQSKMGSMGLNISADVSTEDSDADEPSSEDKQPVADSKKLQVILEESLSGNEEEQEEEHVHNLPNFGEQTKKSRELEALIEETEEEQVSSGDEGLHDETPEPAFNSDLIENSYNKNYDSTLIIAESLEKDFRFSADNDSGKDHSSCEEHIDEEELQGEDEQISSSIEEELSYYEKESCSEEEQATYLEERCARSQEDPVTTQPEGSKFMEKLKQNPGEIITQSVAERVILLEKQVAQSQKAKPTSQSTTIRHPSQIKATLESDEESTSESPTSEVALCTRSAPQSSLSFSYDSSRVITTEPEGRVRSIREMFLAKSATDIQQKRFLSPNVSEQSELKAETSGSGGYQSQTSGELSSGEDDSARKSITKGFVRRTIEMLYGKKDAKPEEASERPPSEPNQKKKEHSSIFSPFHAKPEEASERPPSEPNQEKKEHSSIFSPFHAVRSKAMSEMSYFNSTNALDVFSEATRCIAFHAQVGPGDSVPIDNGRWLLRENMLIRKSVSDPVGINKTFSNTTQDEGLCKDKEEKTPYSLFSTKPELEDNAEPLPRKCTYFSLPHANDSDICQDDQSTVSKSSVNGDSVAEDKDPSEDTKTWAERNGVLPSIGLTDFKGKGNKVYPLVELPPDGEVVLVQPGKGQRVVTRRLQEPDVLDLMYNFCGENCPIL